MTVRFFHLVDGETETIGTITMQDGVLVATPADSIPLQNVLRDEIWVHRGQDPPLKLNAIDHPKEFLAHLQKEFGHGSYFWCKEIKG